jgi:hypothetical protein
MTLYGIIDDIFEKIFEKDLQIEKNCLPLHRFSDEAT